MQDPTCVFMFPNPEKISPPILRLDEAKVGWTPEVPLLMKVNINVDMETRIALVGPNGAGKSTILKTISNILRKSGGDVFFLGDNLESSEPHKIVEIGISHVPEGRRVFPQLTVYENLQMGAYTRDNKDEIEEDLATVYKRFPRLKERENQLSGAGFAGPRIVDI